MSEISERPPEIQSVILRPLDVEGVIYKYRPKRPSEVIDKDDRLWPPGYGALPDPAPPKPSSKTEPPEHAADAQRKARQAFLPDGWRLDPSGCWPAGFYEMKEDKKLQWCEAVREMIRAEALRRGADPKLDGNDLGRALGNDPADLMGWLNDVVSYKESGRVQTASGIVVPFETKEAKAGLPALRGEQKPAEAPPRVITFTPYVWQDPATLKPRRWLYGRHYIRKFLSTTIGAGGGGKSSLDLVEAVAMATGINLLDVPVHDRLRVAYWGEDPKDEIDRRVSYH